MHGGSLVLRVAGARPSTVQRYFAPALRVAAYSTETRTSSGAPAPPPPRPERLRIVPELAAGKLVGVRLFGIQPKGVFAAVGLRNGDRLEAINGIAMNSPEHALSLYSELRSTSDFDLRLARRGRPIALKLHLK